MIAVRVLVHVKPDTREQFINITKLLVVETRREPGCLFYGCYQDLTDPDRFMFYEEYADQAAIEAHGAAEHRNRWFGVVGALLAAPMEVRVLENSDIKDSTESP